MNNYSMTDIEINRANKFARHHSINCGKKRFRFKAESENEIRINTTIVCPECGTEELITDTSSW